MLTRTMLLLGAAAALAAPAAAATADTTVAPDPTARSVSALDGALVWVSGAYGHERLMYKAPGGPARVPGTPEAKSYASIDLGRDAGGRLVLTYLRCRSAGRCTALRDDLQGHRASIRGLTPQGCALSTAPAMWRNRVAYGLDCNDRPLGLYVKTGSGAPRRLPRPHDAVKFGSRSIDWVDLRGTRVGAVAADVYEYAFSQTITGTGLRSFLAAASEGDSDEHVVGLSLGAGGALWTLVDAEHVGDPNQAVIYRLTTGGCLDYESLANPPGPDQESGYRATALAVDGSSLFLTAPPTGIVNHAFAPEKACG
jgi:hypothetical protein